MLHQIKAPQFYTDLGLQKTALKPLANGKIQGLFKAFECCSSTFQGKFYFQDSPVYSSTFQACANPGLAMGVSSQGFLIGVMGATMYLCL